MRSCAEFADKIAIAKAMAAIFLFLVVNDGIL